MADFYQFLANNQIEYERHDHPPVYTVADVERLVPALPAVKTKNLFLRDKKGQRHFLVAVSAPKRVNIKTLGALIGAGHLSFCSPDRLKKYLGVDPGSVSVLATINDSQKAVELIFDAVLWAEAVFQFHPLVNTSTLLITRENLQRFFELTGHEVRLIDVPTQE